MALVAFISQKKAGFIDSEKNPVLKLQLIYSV